MMNYPLLTNTLPTYLWAIIIGGGVLLIAVIVFLIIFFSKRKKTPKIDDGVWLIALGGKENVNSVSAIGSRLTLSLVDKEKVDREKLKELGVSSVLTMSNKVTLVIQKQALEIANRIQEALNN